MNLGVLCPTWRNPGHLPLCSLWAGDIRASTHAHRVRTGCACMPAMPHMPKGQAVVSAPHDPYGSSSAAPGRRQGGARGALHHDACLRSNYCLVCTASSYLPHPKGCPHATSSAPCAAAYISICQGGSPSSSNRVKPSTSTTKCLQHFFRLCPLPLPHSALAPPVPFLAPTPPFPSCLDAQHVSPSPSPSVHMVPPAPLRSYTHDALPPLHALHPALN